MGFYEADDNVCTRAAQRLRRKQHRIGLANSGRSAEEDLQLSACSAGFLRLEFGKELIRVRALLWQYWFTTPQERLSQHLWWRREQLGLYAPVLEREADGRIVVLEWPAMLRLLDAQERTSGYPTYRQ